MPSVGSPGLFASAVVVGPHRAVQYRTKKSTAISDRARFTKSEGVLNWLG